MTIPPRTTNGTSPGDSNGRTPIQQDAVAIWQAGVDAVHPSRLMAQALAIDKTHLLVGTHRLALDDIDRIAIVGGGKAADGMAAAAVAALAGHGLPLVGQINSIGQELDHPLPELAPLHRHVARQPGVNEPTAAAVSGTERILNLVGQLGPRDVCLCLLSGGGSAMLAAPPTGVTLGDKLELIRRLSAAGASIAQLNAVRRCLSRIKGGGLAAHCGAGYLFTLVISDVLGDAIETIASGPTAIGSADPLAAIAVLEKFSSDTWQPPAAVLARLRAALGQRVGNRIVGKTTDTVAGNHVHHVLLANSHTAMGAAADQAIRRGYRSRTLSVEPDQLDANTVGKKLAEELMTVRCDSPACIVSGGEPTVTLAAESQRGKGGRNQQLALAALCRLAEESANATVDFAFLSGGTDGEDGPTDAAGAIFAADDVDQAKHQLAKMQKCLATNDAYSFFDRLGCLLRTGPTGTNVCDLRVLLKA